MSNPVDDVKAYYNFCKSKGINPDTMIVSPALKEQSEAIVKELGLPMSVVTPFDK